MLTSKDKKYIRELIRKNEQELRDFIDTETNSVSIPWTIMDIELTAENLDIELTEKQKLLVLESLRDDFDAESGINWYTLEMAINNVIGE